MALIARSANNVSFSVYKWAKSVVYTVGTTTTTLSGHHAGLTILGAYPGDLTAIKTPTLAVLGYDDDVAGQDMLGSAEAISEDLYAIAFYGFVVLGASQSDQAHLRYRDRLRNDLVQVLRRVGGEAGIPLYDSLSKAEYGVVEVINVRSRLIPVSAPDVMADRYKFVVTGEVPYVD